MAAMARSTPRPSAANPGRMRATTQPEPPSRFPPAGSIGSMRPWLLAAATALWVARPLFPSESAPHGDGLPAVMFWLALAVIGLVGTVGRRPLRLRFGWADGAVLLLVAWHTIAALWAAAYQSPRPALNMLWEWVGFATSFLLTRQWTHSPKQQRALVAVMIALALVLACYGLYQYAYELPATRAAYRADPEGTLAEAGLWSPPGSPERLVFENRLASVEPIATFALTNSLAGLLVPWLVVLLGIVVLGVPGRQHGFLLCARGAALLTLAACLLLTKSRSAYLAALVGIALIGVLRYKISIASPKTWMTLAGGLAAAAMGLVVLMAAWGGLDIQVLSEARKSLGYRGQYWRATAAMIADHPLLGSGPGNFQQAYPAYKLPEASEEIADPHNFLLEVWATAGTPAVLVLVGLLGAFFWKTLRPETEPTKPGETDTPGRAAEDHPGFVFVGAAFGFVLAVPLSSVSPAPPRWELLAAGPFLGAVVVGLLWQWVQHGRLPSQLTAIGAAVLLVHLLAAGGISYAGVSGSLWVLMAVGLNSASTCDPIRLRAWVSLGLLLVAVGIACACYGTGYRPVLQCRAALAVAQRSPSRAEPYLLEAARADPLSSEPYQLLAAIAFADWQRSPTEANLLRAERYLTEAMARQPNAWSLRLVAGDRSMEVFQKTKARSALDSALEHYREAVRLYPHRAENHAKLALALKAAGDRAGYSAEREQALRLDQLTPHLDKKLPDELRKSLQRNDSEPN